MESFRFLWRNHPQKVIIILAGLAVVTLAPSITYYSMSYNSVNGTHPQLVTGYRQVGFFVATFYVTVHVWSWATSIDTQVVNPAFSLTVDNFPFGTQTAPAGTFQPNNYISYTLKFQANDSSVARTIGDSSSNNLFLQMSADVTAGWYHGLLTRSDSQTWTFSG